jgi:enoyl-CoA hydratase/carnithine racemase
MTGSVTVSGPSPQGVVEVRVANPGRRNAISSSMWRALAAFAADMEGSSARCVLVRGAGGVFSSGADISEFDTSRGQTHEAREYDDLVERTCAALERVPQPTIAVIEGVCFGAGLSLAASCDLRMATPEAMLCVPAARLGLGYDVRGIARLHRVLGPALATQMLLTAQPLRADRAHATGAIQFLAEGRLLASAADALATTIAANAPLTLRAAKAALRAENLGDAEARERAAALTAAADESADYREGRAAFAAKRPPRFEGR